MGKSLLSLQDGEKLVFWGNVCAGDTMRYFGVLDGNKLIGVSVERKLLRQWQSYDGVWCEYELIPKWDEFNEDFDFEIDFRDEKLCYSTGGEDYWFDDIWDPKEKYLVRWRVFNYRGGRRSSN